MNLKCEKHQKNEFEEKTLGYMLRRIKIFEELFLLKLTENLLLYKLKIIQMNYFFIL